MVLEGNDYPTLLGKRLGFPILRFGSPDATTQDALGRLNDVLQANPKVVLLCFGHEQDFLLFGQPLELGTVLVTKSDYVHPNDQGYTVIAERLEKVLGPLLPELMPN